MWTGRFESYLVENLKGLSTSKDCLRQGFIKLYKDEEKFISFCKYNIVVSVYRSDL